MTGAEQEGLIMFLILVSGVSCWGIWMVRMIRQWEKEEERWAEHKRRQQRVMEARRNRR